MKAKKKVMDVLESKMDFERKNDQKVFKKREVLDGVKLLSVQGFAFPISQPC